MLLHASCIVLNGKAVLLAGPPGTGTSDLALRLIDEGAQLLSDDQTVLQREEEELIATPPPTIEGLMEIRHIGLVQIPFVPSAPVALYIELTPQGEALERLPSPDPIFLLDQPIQRYRLPAFAASTPAKIRAALTYVLKT